MRLFAALAGAFAPPPATGGVQLYIAARPLIGGPSFFPIHCALRCESTDGSAVIDIVPTAPREIATALTLVTFGDVDAEIRIRPSPGRRDARWKFVGDSPRSAADIRAFAAAQPRRIRLRDENCWTFASRVAAYAVDDVR